MDEANTIIFLHIPKTAGTTLNQILQRQYDPARSFFLGANAQASIAEYCSLPQTEKRRIRLVAGHTAFGFHRYVPGHATYFTFLREPLDRVVSFYHYVRRSDQHYLNQAVAQEYTTIDSFVASGITKMVDNGQTRMISGAWLEPPFAAVDEELFAQARANIENYFAVAGMTEQFDATLLLLRNAFGWTDTYYVRQNVGQAARRERILTPTERSLLERYNKWDLALYEFVRERFERQKALLGASFERQLQDFQQRNASYHPRHGVMARAQHWAREQQARAAALRSSVKDLLGK